ncbi:glycine zipper 2TM domain-containing protein [Luteimonas sp. SDU101]|uniref:glycine zipper 2TM domain-containing protein n=1 Tax=Luteimonas sp. SDU101 TaxID=3422593 RepID=UPI003EBFB6F4
MKPIGIALASALLLSAGAASAQTYDDRYGPAPYGDYSHRTVPDRYPYGRDRAGDPALPEHYSQGEYDWARVVRVDPVFDGRARPVQDPRRCQTRRDGYVSSDPYRDGYGNDRGYDGYADPYRQSRRDENGRTLATVVGGIAGAVLGSQVGGGSGRYIGTAVGSMVGGVAGRGIYEANRRERDAYVTVCEPDPYRGEVYDSGGDAYGRAVDRYDVTYEYAGRHYTTRTGYHPGDRIRVRVDVRAE